MIILSVVTPTYNRREKLDGNIKSVLSQNFHNMEHIIVDNLSDDGTEKLVEEYKTKAKYKVKYIREKDKGLYQAMNKGIKKATGEWIHILNSDDKYSERKILSDIFSRSYQDYDMIICPIIHFSRNKKIIWKPEYMKDVNHYYFPHPGMIVKKEFYKHNGLYDEKYKIVSDALYMFANLKKASYKICDYVLTEMSGGGASEIMSFRGLIEKLISYWIYSGFRPDYKFRVSAELIYSYMKHYARFR